MESSALFTQVEDGLAVPLEELRRLEPIFHTAEFGQTAAAFDRRMAPGYWEVGASGRRYGRAFILEFLAQNPPVDAGSAGWICSKFGLRALGAVFLLTYTLQQRERITRRATIWEKADGRWRIVFHQGTIVPGEEHDRIPV
ncbi:MAG TPA: DUF4440 domain-containing protein [Acidobacteriaceae bacterium]|jgi:hypothetical protein|nr:DUF4440 domain-containing protein [Acidobacteriaceae bacterium]